MNAVARRELDERIAPLHRLNHPFYQAWVDGRLTKEDLARYAEQYWHHIDAFPIYLRSLETRLPEGIAREAIRANLRDEVEGHHDDLWIDFAEAVGVAPDDLQASRPSEATATAIDDFTAACSGASPAFALGALYAYESHTPATAVTKSEGLSERYGVDEKGRAYFDVHAEVDKEHSNDLYAAISDIAGDPATWDEALAGAEAGARATWKLLDGIAADCGIDC